MSTKVVPPKTPLEQLTTEQIREVPCIRCDAAISEPCSFSSGSMMVQSHHKERVELRRKLPIFHNLDATDKSLIWAYAYVILCDSVAVSSTKLMGKELTSLEVQKFFCAKAIEELKRDGFLK